jgi:hypothetical protein
LAKKRAIVLADCVEKKEKCLERDNNCRIFASSLETKEKTEAI